MGLNVKLVQIIEDDDYKHERALTFHTVKEAEEAVRLFFEPFDNVMRYNLRPTHKVRIICYSYMDEGIKHKGKFKIIEP